MASAVDGIESPAACSGFTNDGVQTLARLAQSVERKALNLVVVGSSPTVADYALHYHYLLELYVLVSGGGPPPEPRERAGGTVGPHFSDHLQQETPVRLFRLPEPQILEIEVRY
ncbi:hypothetical protein CRG98_025792 [Punica granatum]|uniref:Uncharacterized protein n=1 Tax=Punica granatum TaxID=22663 RepID=A0A2I0JDQ4_PUNGR|nr:hypothetical protein CRG98_025792 [Punica granatum]